MAVAAWVLMLCLPCPDLASAALRSLMLSYTCSWRRSCEHCNDAAVLWGYEWARMPDDGCATTLGPAIIVPAAARERAKRGNRVCCEFVLRISCDCNECICAHVKFGIVQLSRSPRVVELILHGHRGRGVGRGALQHQRRPSLLRQTLYAACKHARRGGWCARCHALGAGLVDHNPTLAQCSTSRLAHLSAVLYCEPCMPRMRTDVRVRERVRRYLMPQALHRIGLFLGPLRHCGDTVQHHVHLCIDSRLHTSTCNVAVGTGPVQGRPGSPCRSTRSPVATALARRHGIYGQVTPPCTRPLAAIRRATAQRVTGKHVACVVCVRNHDHLRWLAALRVVTVGRVEGGSREGPQPPSAASQAASSSSMPNAPCCALNISVLVVGRPLTARGPMYCRCPPWLLKWCFESSWWWGLGRGGEGCAATARSSRCGGGFTGVVGAAPVLASTSASMGVCGRCVRAPLTDGVSVSSFVGGWAA